VTGSAARSYFFGAMCVAIVTGVGAAFAIWTFSQPVLGWAGIGWTVASAVSVSTGTWAAWKHGSPGSGFLAAVFGGIALRAAVTVAGLMAALLAGGSEGWLFLVGSAAGLVPQWVFEIAWFHRRGRAWAMPASTGHR
jgi:hypothetical protein